MLNYNEKFAEPDGGAYEILFSRVESNPFDKNNQQSWVIIALDMNHAIEILKAYCDESAFLTILSCNLVSPVIVSDAKCVHDLRQHEYSSDLNN